ncbi:hypothetical protein HMPREF1624_01872 [Sporothrix schenckii ATCC 58251]|uniref:Uncharacterized protein n=1 Tax=Sporothrix schenckii (strain ATCC 58251 / de Perez 2211183) TaxID=1391915 RepID=U7Q0X3_SPOS1|nr:hypothetical protein HMPREF1624_01872 [Sporothrix schenckii ATCC 58251]
MPRTANKPPPQTAGRPKNARAAVVPVIPLPIAQKQQLQRQQKQQDQLRLKQQQLDLEKEQQELTKQKEMENQAPAQEATKAPEEDTSSLNGDDNHKTVEPAAVVSTPVEKASQLASASTPQTVVDASVSLSSPSASKTPQSSTNTTLADPTVAPFVPTTTTADKHAPASGPVVSGASQPHIPAGPASAGLQPNGPTVPEFVFPPHSRSGSAARHRGPPRHNPQFPPHPQHPFHQQHHQHPGFHQPHPSASSITFGAFHDSNNVSPVPTGHGPLPPPPGLIGGPQFVPYNMPNIGPGEWQGPPGVPPGGDVNGFAPSSAGFNPSTPGSFRGSHSPDNVTDGPAFHHQAGGIPPPGGLNGHLPLRNNDSMSSMMSPPFFPPSGFPNAGPDERQGRRDDAPNRGIDFQFVHHLQQQLQHNFDNPQTSDCHLILHLPKANASSNNGAELNGPEQQHGPTTMFAGHRGVLAQSQSIGHLLRSDIGTIHSGPFNRPILALHMKIEDPYISVEAAVQALRSLYGHPLADTQSLDKALSNLTAGFIFMLDHVESVGAEQAGRLIDWTTVEKVLAYGLNGASFPNAADGNTNPNGPAYAHADLRYGRGAGLSVRRLLSQALDFVVRNFPTNFVFNAAVATSTGPLSTLLRFPADTTKTVPATDVPQSTATKAASDGTTAHIRSAGSVSLPMRGPNDSSNSKKGGPRSPKIVFGGFADELANVAHGSINGVLSAADNSQADAATVLSRILINLPYDYLKYVLGHSQLTADRASITRDIVEERERRRLQALEVIHAGDNLNSPEQRDAILGRLQRPTPPLHRDHPIDIDVWDVLGWKEVCHGDTGELVRVWAHADASR